MFSVRVTRGPMQRPDIRGIHGTRFRIIFRRLQALNPVSPRSRKTFIVLHRFRRAERERSTLRET